VAGEGPPANPHGQTDVALWRDEDAGTGANGRRKLTAEERAALSDRVNRARLERQDAERAEKDARLREAGDDLDLGTASLGDLQERFGE